MAHVIILRYSPSFRHNQQSVLGTHEMVEQEINKRKYSYTGAVEGYCIPFSSQIQLLDYRIKKECVPDFLADLCAYNWHPATNPVKLRHVLGIIKHPDMETFRGPLIGKSFGRLRFILYFLYRRGLWLAPADKSDKTPEKFFPNTFCYNFFLGVLPDVETEWGEEL